VGLPDWHGRPARRDIAPGRSDGAGPVGLQAMIAQPPAAGL